MKKILSGIVIASMLSCVACASKTPETEPTFDPVPTTVETTATTESTTETSEATPTTTGIDDLIGDAYQVIDLNIKSIEFRNSERAKTKDGRNLPTVPLGTPVVLQVSFNADEALVDPYGENTSVFIRYAEFDKDGNVVNSKFLDEDEYIYENISLGDDTPCVELRIVDGVISTENNSIIDIYVYNTQYRSGYMGICVIGDASQVSWLSFDIALAPPTQTNSPSPENPDPIG